MGRLSLKPVLCGHILDINKLRTSLWNLDKIQNYSRRGKGTRPSKICQDCGGIEIVESVNDHAETCSDDKTKSTTNDLGLKAQPGNIAGAHEQSQSAENVVKQGTNQHVQSTSNDGSHLKNDVTATLKSEEDCGCREAQKQELLKQDGSTPNCNGTSVDIASSLKPIIDTSIKVEVPCLKLNDGPKIVLDQGVVGTYDCKLTKRKYKIKKFIWKNKSNNTEIEAITLGATVTRMILPDRNGMLKDVLLGFDNHEDYITKANYYLGSTIGRCANMISNPIFQYDGVCSNLSINRLKKHHYNGGCSGFNKYVWSPYVCGNKVIFNYLSKDGSEGYPGELLTSVSMELTNKNTFEIDIQASTTDPTICNISNRLLFNLSSHAGGGSQLRKHIMHVNADNYIGYDERGLPVCSPRRTRRSEYDAACATTIQELMQNWKNRDFRSAYVINRASKQDTCLAARFIHDLSGRTLEVHTNQPIINIDFGFDLPRANDPVDKRLIGKCKVRYINNSSICVQPQGYPDAINHKDFPTSLLMPGELYRNKIIYQFGIVDKMKYGPQEKIEVCEKVSPPKPECCNKLEGDTTEFQCEKDLYCDDAGKEKDDVLKSSCAKDPKPLKPCD